MANAFVYVVESPSDADLLYGRMEGQSLRESLRLAGIPHEYSLVTSHRTFNDAIRGRLIDAMNRNPNRFPILHLSLHGDKDGVALTHGELTWEELRTILAPLHNALQGRVLVCMSSCFGASGIQMAMNTLEDQPFMGLLGNMGEVLWADACVAYITFYHLLFKNKPLEDCVNAMRMASGDINFQFHIGHAIKQDWRANYGQRLAEAVKNFGNVSTGVSQLGSESGLLPNIGHHGEIP